MIDGRIHRKISDTSLARKRQIDDTRRTIRTATESERAFTSSFFKGPNIRQNAVLKSDDSVATPRVRELPRGSGLALGPKNSAKLLQISTGLAAQPWCWQRLGCSRQDWADIVRTRVRYLPGRAPCHGRFCF
jgi:hypothetical protein